MSSSSQTQQVRPSPLWYLVVVALWVGAAVIAFVSFKPFFDLVSSGITPTQNNGSIQVPADGLTVYGRVDAADRSCSLLGGDSGNVRLETFKTDLNVDRYFALASTPEATPAGTYQLSCPGVGRNASLGLGKRFDVGALAERAVFGVALPLLIGFIGLVILIVLLVKRHNSKSRLRNAQAQSASGYYGGYPASGGYPPSPPGQYPPPGSYPPPSGSYQPPPDSNPPRRG